MGREPLEVELGDEKLNKLRALRNVSKRKLRIEDSKEGVLEGKFNRSIMGWGYVFHTGRKDIILDYENLQRAFILNPKKGDERRANYSYLEVTQKTIDMTTKWARKGYRV